jgi:hypothetical protein
MKILYLKLEVCNEILSVCKIIDGKGSLSAFQNDICFYPDQDLKELKLKGGFKEATRAEFDSFYTTTAKKVNNASSI